MRLICRQVGIIEKFCKFVGHGTAQLLGINNGHRAPIIARDIVTDANGNKFNRRLDFDIFNDIAQMFFKIIAGIDRQRAVINRRRLKSPS